MVKSAWVLVVTVGLIFAIGEPNSFAQFGGRGGLGGIFGGTSRGGRGNTQNSGNNVTRPIPDSYEQTEHRLALMEADLHLTPQQREPWQTFTDKVRAYASDLSRERARTGIPASEGTPISGLQHIDLITDGARDPLKRTRGYSDGCKRALCNALARSEEDRGCANGHAHHTSKRAGRRRWESQFFRSRLHYQITAVICSPRSDSLRISARLVLA